MTPRSLSRIHEDDELLDALGGRGAVPDDGLPGMLQSWVSEIDTTPGAVPRTGTKRRHAMRLTGAGGVVLATLSISSVAVAVSGTDVPVLHQLGQVANVFWGDGGDRQRLADGRLPSATSTDTSRGPGDASTSSRQGGQPVAPGTSGSDRSTSRLPDGTPTRSTARPAPTDLPRVPAPRSTNPAAGRPDRGAGPSSTWAPRPTSTSVPRPTSSTSSPSASSSTSPSAPSSSAPSSTRPSPTRTTGPSPTPRPTKKPWPGPSDQGPNPGRRVRPPAPTGPPGLAPSVSQDPTGSGLSSPSQPVDDGSDRLPQVLHGEADV